MTAPDRRDVAATLYVATMTVLAAVAAWPIYRSTAFVVLVCAASVIGALIAFLARRSRAPGWAALLVTAGAFLVVGVPLAVPSRLSSPAEWPQGLLEVLTGTVTGWKDLLTVDLPVGSYRNLLVPALVVFLGGVVLALGLAWRTGAAAVGAVATAIAMVFFGLVFGRTHVSETLVLGPVEIPAPVETATGALALIASLLWLAWRSYDERSRALRRAAAGSGVRVSRRRSASDARRMALGAIMVVGSVAAGAVIAPAIAEGAQRQVLRSATGPELELSAAISPLAQYRSHFSDARLREPLFRVDVEGDVLPERIRIATLDYYDGQTFRAQDPAAALEESRYVRVPARLDAGEGEEVVVTVEISGLDGIWMPTAGRLQSVSFSGSRQTALADGFYYSADAAGGIQVAGDGLATGDQYRLTAVVADTPALEEISAPGYTAAVAAPESLRAWVRAHVSGTGGQALAGLVALLRERGYLSHGLSDQDGTAQWVADLPGYRFVPSASGHSVARVGVLFDDLLARESAVSSADESLVAAIGDDEQFAAATALIAQELGFPARVVVGARLTSDDPSVSVCDDGLCRGGDITAWTEVLSSEGEWVAVDVTPQSTESPAEETTRQRDPEVPTEVRPDTAELVDPPDPVQQDAQGGDVDEGEAVDLSGLWAVLRAGGLALLVAAIVLGPFLAVVLAKLLRRRARRRRPDATGRIAAGWQEYLDAAVDSGRPDPGTRTRTELAALYRSPSATALADRADRAVFGAEASTDAEAEEFWGIVDAERRSLREGRLWRRVLAALSLRSFTRSLPPARATAPHSSRTSEERRSRRS